MNNKNHDMNFTVKRDLVFFFNFSKSYLILHDFTIKVILDIYIFLNQNTDMTPLIINISHIHPVRKFNIS